MSLYLYKKWYNLIHLIAPQILNIKAIPGYFGETGALSKITLTFYWISKRNSLTILMSIILIWKERVFFYDEFDGSAQFYTISYFDMQSGSICSSVNIQSSHCIGRECIHVFDISTSDCPLFTNITATVVATNLLGDGPPTDPILISWILLISLLPISIINVRYTGGHNHFVEVQFHNNVVNCTFLNLTGSFVKLCQILYGPIAREDFMSHCANLSLSSSGSPTISNKISIPLLLMSGVSSYCNLLRATSGSVTIGTFTIGIYNICFVL